MTTALFERSIGNIVAFVYWFWFAVKTTEQNRTSIAIELIKHNQRSIERN